MKKTGLFKIIMFVLLGIALITWFVSASFFQEGELVELGMYNIGFFDYFQLIINSFEFSYFIQILILLLSIGALYGVLGKTGKYRALVEKIANNFKGAELPFLLITAIVIVIISSVFDYGLIMFIFFPFIISILLQLGYDKITAILDTFGSMLIGTIGSTLGANTAGMLHAVLETNFKDCSLYSLILLALALVVFIFFLAKSKRLKKKEYDEKEDMFIGEKISNKYSVAPIIVIFSLIFVIMVLGCTNWKETFDVDVFENFHTNLTTKEFKLPYVRLTSKGFETGKEKVAIFGKLFGKVNPFGAWQFTEMSIVCLLAALILGICYKMKFKDRLKYMYDGAKKMMQPALTVMLIYTVIYFAGNTLFYPTIVANVIGLTNKFNLVLNTLLITIGSALHVDMLYLANYVVPQLATQNIETNVLATMVQGLHGSTMLIAPTSAVIALGLSYLGVNYKDWVKRIWKLALILFAITIVVTVLAILL